VVTNSALYAAKRQREGSQTWNVWINDRNNNRVEDAGRNTLGASSMRKPNSADPDVSRLATFSPPLCGVGVPGELPRKLSRFLSTSIHRLTPGRI